MSAEPSPSAERGAAGDDDESVVVSERLRAFEMLDREQRLTVGLVYYQGLTIADVARRLAVSPERVSRVLTLALGLMREASIAVITADRAVDGSSLERHRRSIQRALEQGPRLLCLDLKDTRIFDVDGARFLAETAMCCDSLGVELRLLGSPAVAQALLRLGLTDDEAMVAFARTTAAEHPTCTGDYAFAHAVGSMTANQLVSAHIASSEAAREGATAVQLRRSHARLAAVATEQRRRADATDVRTTDMAPPVGHRQPSAVGGD